MRIDPQEIDFLLSEYLDGRLSGEQLASLKSQIEGSPKVKNRLQELRVIHSSLQQSKIEQPSANFTALVMNNLSQVPDISKSLFRNGFLLLSGILVAMGIGVVYVDAGIFDSMNGIFSINNFTLPEVLKQQSLPNLPLNGKWIMNSIIAVNLGLAFLVLDRTILKPFFSRRANMNY